MNEPALLLDRFGFRPAGSSRWAVSGVDLSVRRGEKVLLLGASGVGKSTVLRAVAGVLDAGGTMAGQVTVDGLPAQRARDRVGLLLQDPDAGLVLTRAGEDVAFGPQNRGCPPDEVARRVASSLRAVGFRYPESHPITALSGGERQRLALAGVLALQPSLLLLDEPTSMLDQQGATMVRDAVRRVCEQTECTLVVVEHDVETWLDLIDRVVVLGPDGVEADGSAEQVRRSRAAASTWLTPGAPPVRPQAEVGPSLVSAVDVGFEHRDQPEPVLSGVDVQICAGSTLALVGPNGSGKTTLAHLLGGLMAPCAGEVVGSSELLAGARLGPNPHRWRAPDLAGRIGSVFQNPEHAFLTGSVREELMVGPLALGSGEQAARSLADELIDRLRLGAVAGQSPFSLSGGEQRRLSVAAAVATSPRVLVLDEPTFGQDPMTWRELAELTSGLAAGGAAVVVATHDERFRATVADRVLALGGSPVGR